jgi:hypothetical protein
MLDLFMEYHKESKETLIKNYDELYNTARDAIQDAPSDEHRRTLAICMLTCAQKKQILLDK